MIKGKIFLADERGVTETGWLRTCNTFCFGNYRHEHKQPVGSLYVLNDDTLAGGCSLNMLVEANTYVLVLPVAGAVEAGVIGSGLSLAVAGQAMLIRVQAGAALVFKNPFQEDPVNYLEMWFRADAMEIRPGSETFTYPDVNENINRFVPAIGHTDTGLPFAIAVGKFSGRGDTVYKSSMPSSVTFLFVLEGAFEAEGRLLHARDGLALYDAKEAEIEALSNDALIVLIEIPLRA